MEVRISSGWCDQGTAHIEEAVRAALAYASKKLSKDFGPGLDHLWIDVELSPGLADRRPPFPFRFQKRVNSQPGLVPKKVMSRLDLPPSYNVGHYSLRPNYFDLAKVPVETMAAYLLELIYESTAVLEKRQRSFPKFRVSEFRNSFRQLIENHAYES